MPFEPPCHAGIGGAKFGGALIGICPEDGGPKFGGWPIFGGGPIGGIPGTFQLGPLKFSP